MYVFKKLKGIALRTLPGLPGEGLIRRELAAVERKLRESVSCDIPALGEMASLLVRSGGKRLRPRLLLLSARLLGPAARDAVRAAAAMELLHLASLLHDDVVDEAKTRRGETSANIRWGNRTSILLGDYLLSHALLHLSEAGMPEILKIVAGAASEMAAGQMMENLSRHGEIATEEDYLLMIRYKTASLTSASCEVGSLLQGASRQARAALSKYGLNLGLAFQILDDCLDLWGDAKKLGKATGVDLLNRKPTLPLLHLLKTAPAKKTGPLRRILSGQAATPAEMRRILELTDQHGSREYAFKLAEKFSKAACRALNNFSPSPALSALREMAEYVLWRES